VTAVGGGSAAVAEDRTGSGPPRSEAGSRSGSTGTRPQLPAAWALPVVAVLVYLLDQASKHWALQELRDGPIDIVGSLRLNLVFNTGAAFSGGAGLGPLIGVLVFVIVVVLILGRHRVIDSVFGAVAVGMIAGGAIGNLSDRLLRAGDGFLGGGVVDFIDFQWWPVFNVADAAVVLGGLMLVLESVRADSTPSSPSAASTEPR
jgi:signal peptidase II